MQGLINTDFVHIILKNGKEKLCGEKPLWVLCCQYLTIMMFSITQNYCFDAHKSPILWCPNIKIILVFPQKKQLNKTKFTGDAKQNALHSIISRTDTSSKHNTT